MKTVAIWGTGDTGQSWYWAAKSVVSVECFFTNTEERIGSTIFDVPVKKWTPDNDIFIIIASKFWKDIALQLMRAGKKPIRDFMPWFTYRAYMRNISYQGIYETRTLSSWGGGQYGKIRDCLLENKKIAVIYGNCQTGYYDRLFATCKPFYSDYIIVETGKVCEYAEDMYWNTLLHDKDFWESVDLFIYQTVDEANRFSPLVASDNILRLLRSDCKRVNIVNLFFDGYFPQLAKSTARLLSHIQQSGLFPFGDKYVDGFLEQGKTLSEILSRVKREDFIPLDEIKKGAESSLKELERREKTADVKIVDYLRAHYKEKQLFYSTNHPCCEVLDEYARRIFQFIGEKYARDFPDKEDVFLQRETLQGQDIPVYPSVIRALELEQYEKRYYPNRYMLNHADTLLDFEEYMTLYIQVCSLSDQNAEGRI